MILRDARKAANRDAKAAIERSAILVQRVERLVRPAIEHIHRHNRVEAERLLGAVGGLSADDPMVRSFSTLGPAGRGRDEVANTKTLGFLLNPGAGHSVAVPLRRALVRLIANQPAGSSRKRMQSISDREIVAGTAATERWVRHRMDEIALAVVDAVQLTHATRLANIK